MRTKIFAVALMAAVLMVPFQAAWGLVIAPPPGPVRIVNSDAVFVGKVTQIEPVDVDAKAFPGAKDTIKYRIAVVQVQQIIRGLKNEKSVRVGFVPITAPKPGRPIIGGRRPVQLELGQEGLFMIAKHNEGKFYLAPNFGYFVPMSDKKFDDEVKTAKKVVTILADTKSALQAKDADERLLAASLVIAQYRTQKPPFPNKEEPIDAAETKLILGAINTANWAQPFVFGKTHPQQLFFQLGIGPNDGFKAPMKINSPDDMKNAVQGWIRDHPDYRIKRFVAGK